MRPSTRTGTGSPRLRAPWWSTAGREQLPTPENDDGSAPVFYVASVPAAAVDVAVELSASGLAQQFSLVTGARVGVQPAVLYRDRVSAQPLDQLNAERDLATPDPADNLPGATLPIRLHDVYLSWFGPGGPGDVPPSPDRAWLVLDATSQDDSAIGSRYLHYLTGLAASQVTLSLPDGESVGSHLVNPGGGEHGVGVFDGSFDFLVPADVTAATVVIAPASFQVTVAYSGSKPQTITATGQASFPISFPAPYQPPAAVAPSRSATAPAGSAASSTGPAPSSSGGGAPSPLIAVFLVAALAAGLTVAARRRRHHPRTAPTLTLPPIPDVPAHHVTENAEPLSQSAADFPATADAPPARTPPDSLVASPAPPGPAPAPSSPPAPPASAPAAVTLVAIPAAAPVPPEDALYVSVLGPFRIDGWPGEEPRSAPVVELAAYLALHPERSFTPEELRDPLSVGKSKALNADTVRSYAGLLRKAAGVERLPEATRQGYRLVGAATDWHRFLAHAQSTAGPASAREAERLVAALNLVRGPPYAALPASGFGWVATELLVSQVEVAVLDAADRLVELALAAGDWTLAAWAAARALMVSPTAESANGAALRAAARSGQPDRVAQTWRDVTRRYAAANEAAPDDLAQFYDQIRRSA